MTNPRGLQNANSRKYIAEFNHTDRDTEKRLAITLATAVTRGFYTRH